MIGLEVTEHKSIDYDCQLKTGKIILSVQQHTIGWMETIRCNATGCIKEMFCKRMIKEWHPLLVQEAKERFLEMVKERHAGLIDASRILHDHLKYF